MHCVIICIIWFSNCTFLGLKYFIFKVENISMIPNLLVAPVFPKGRKDSPICKNKRTFLHSLKLGKAEFLSEIQLSLCSLLTPSSKNCLCKSHNVTEFTQNDFYYVMLLEYWTGVPIMRNLEILVIFLMNCLKSRIKL